MIYYRLELSGSYSFGTGYLLPDGAEELTEKDYQKAVEAAKSVQVELPTVVTLYQIDLWTRLDGGKDGNGGEVAKVLAAMEQQPIRIRKIFESATSYRSDHELWPLLKEIATALFGEERAAEILAPSSSI